jgi:hypothetical protein
MPNLKISQLSEALTANTIDVIAIVNENQTKKITYENFYSGIPSLSDSATSDRYIVPVTVNGQNGSTHHISALTESYLFRLSYTGASNGAAILYLPDATTNTNRAIRVISDGTVTNQKYFDITPVLGQTLDGSTSPYSIGSSKSYDGVMIWSDGVEWFRIQSKG